MYNQGLRLWRAGRIDDASLVDRLQGIQKERGGETKSLYPLMLIHLERDDADSALKLIEEMETANYTAYDLEAVRLVAERMVGNADRLPVREVS